MIIKEIEDYNSSEFKHSIGICNNSFDTSSIFFSCVIIFGNVKANLNSQKFYLSILLLQIKLPVTIQSGAYFQIAQYYFIQNLA